MAAMITRAAAARIGIIPPAPARRAKPSGRPRSPAAPEPTLPEPTGEVVIDIPGLLVVPKERPHLGQGNVYTPKRTVSFTKTVKDHARLIMRGKGALRGAIEADVVVILPVPDGWPPLWREAALARIVKPTARPDGDNVIKACLDALNKVVYRDDALVADFTIRRFYGPAPRLTMRFWRIPGTIGSSELRQGGAAIEAQLQALLAAAD